MSHTVTRLRNAAVERAVRGPGTSSGEARRAAFDNAGVPAAAAALVDKIAHAPSEIDDADIAAARAAGLSEDEIFGSTALGIVVLYRLLYRDRGPSVVPIAMVVDQHVLVCLSEAF